MSVQTIRPARNRATTPDTSIALSPAIWGACPIGAIAEGEIPGVISEFYFDTMPKTVATTEGNFGLFSQFAGATGAITADAAASAWDFTSTASGDGVAIRNHATPFRIDRSVGKFYFECRVKTSLITDALSSIFLGLIEDVALTAAVPIASTSTLSSNNMVGFWKKGTGTGSGAVMNTAYRAAGVATVTVQAAAVALTAATYTKLGMVYAPFADPMIADPNFTGLAKYNLSFFQDGILLATTKQIPVAQGTDFPNSVYMGPVFAWEAANSSPDVFAIDWFKAVQVFAPGDVN